MKVVILCGGVGTRMREETEFKPKPLVEIGGRPILWHIMKLYSYFGFKDFVLCLGYKGDMIKEYFMHYDWIQNDFTLKIGEKKEIHYEGISDERNWGITFADTGLTTNTGGRIKKIEKYIGEDAFLATYGDGVANIDIKKLIEYHNSKKKSATLTGVHPTSRFGVLETESNGLVTGFNEKPNLDGWINGGFFVFEKKIFDYLDENSVLEQKPLSNLARDRQLSVYKHEGFWACMDTFKDAQTLNEIWSRGNVPWKVWQK